MPDNCLRIIKRIWSQNGPGRVGKTFLRRRSKGEDEFLDLLSDGVDATRTLNLFDQTQTANRVLKQMQQVSSLLTSALNIHLNVEQQFTMNTSNVFMSLQTLKVSSLLGREIQSVGNARLRLPLTWNLSLDEQQTGSLRVRPSCQRLMPIDFSL